MSTKALRGRVLEMIRNIRNGQPWVFEDPSSVREPSHCEIPFRSRKMGPEETTHQGTRNYPQIR